MAIADQLRLLTQRVGANAGKLRTEAERAAFVSNVRGDIANIIEQYNTVANPIFSTLHDDVLVSGLDGQTVYTKTNATAADAAVFYDLTLLRALTVKESMEVVVSELSRLENMISAIDSAAVYDDSALTTMANTAASNIEQLALDTMGVDYTLDADGAANLVYSLSQIIDALGAFFTGYTPSGNTYDTTYPALSFTGSTLQGSYDSGTTDAGLVILENAKGHVVIQDDNTTPIGVYLEWQDDSAVSMGEIGDEGIKLKTDTAQIELVMKAVEPAVVASAGTVHVYNDGTGDAELFYRNDDAGDDNAQVTRNGIVKELEVGCDWINPLQMVNTAGAPGRVGILVGAGPATDMEYEAVQLPNAGPTTLYVSLVRPKDENGLFPSVAHIEVFTSPTQNIGAGPVAYTLDLFVNDSTIGAGSDVEAIAYGSVLTPVAWSSLTTLVSDPLTMPGDLNRLDKLAWVASIDSVAGMIPLKIVRAPADPSDDYTGTVSILGMRVTWYR